MCGCRVRHDPGKDSTVRHDPVCRVTLDMILPRFFVCTQSVSPHQSTARAACSLGGHTRQVETAGCAALQMPPKRRSKGGRAQGAPSRDSLLLGALHGAGGDEDSNNSARREHSAVSIGDVSVVEVDAQNPRPREGDVAASNIVASGKKRGHRGGGGARQPSKQHKLTQDGDESLPFHELVQFLLASGWICTRSFTAGPPHPARMTRIGGPPLRRARPGAVIK